MSFWNLKKPKIMKNPFGDSDRDGVINLYDCAPNNPKKQEVLKWEIAKPKVVSKKHLFHKTSLEAARRILKTGELKPGHITGKVHLSEDYNPHVVFKEYEEPVVLVLEKKRLPSLEKVNYNQPYKYNDLKFKSEKEWIIPGAKIKTVLKGVLLNEGRKLKSLPPNTPGVTRITTISYPTKYITGKDIYKI